MQVRTLVGRYAGEIVEMPYHVATAALANGTAIKPDAPYVDRRAKRTAAMEPAEISKAVVQDSQPETPAPEVPPPNERAHGVPAGWESMHHKTQLRLARERGYEGEDRAADVRAYLATLAGAA